MMQRINIPVHGYIDLKGDKVIIEDKCKFPRKGKIKKNGTRSWFTSKLPEDKPEPFNLLQVDFYWSVRKEFKVQKKRRSCVSLLYQ